ncbi:hypothetical protein [Leadbettera azotonutricia]|uniref:Putative lipoprotein n=1 Tax=Leadbettera azotonutricia (strain ATCC BAA-888 / DSM 13862 / ZAS-9) TaxID=545695 RepID=F5Y6L6_LEAAZ|nr:hypothetical protein [Leadbettera azotonutricia]AEF83420.1 putative lipoprotein [Leadbettera azotonutricia ZAS-9]
MPVPRPCFRTAGLLLFVSFLFWGCKTSAPGVENFSSRQALQREHFYTPPQKGKLVFLGVAGIRSKLEDSIQLALEDAARKVAIFERVEGEFATFTRMGGRFLDYRSETNSSLIYDTGFRRYIERLEFDREKDVFTSENAVFVRVVSPGNPGEALRMNPEQDYHPSYSGSAARPSWIDDPPQTISGYAVGIGYAGRRNAHRDTVISSYENAIFSIVRDTASVSWGRTIGYRGGGLLDYAAITRSGINARAVLNGFYVLDIWTDPSNKAVWTLAVAAYASQ